MSTSDQSDGEVAGERYKQEKAIKEVDDFDVVKNNKKVEMRDFKTGENKTLREQDVEYVQIIRDARKLTDLNRDTERLRNFYENKLIH